MAQRLVVGLTGTFGSGKSTVSKIFKTLGARKVIDADALAHEAVQAGHPVRKRLERIFKTRRLDRKAIAAEVFTSKKKRRQLEAILHPYVYRRIRSELKRIHKGIVILEVPLLFETKGDRLCDVTVTVLTDEKSILKRLRNKRFQAPEIRSRMKAQFSQREKAKRSDLLIKNSNSKAVLLQKTKTIWKKLVQFQNKK